MIRLAKYLKPFILLILLAIILLIVTIMIFAVNLRRS